MPTVIKLDGVTLGKPVGSGHCVALLQHQGQMPLTGRWRRGAQVRGAHLERGTAIATFSDDDLPSYENAMDGRSHAAVFLEETEQGIRVLDQWQGRGVSERVIRAKNGAGPKVDDADMFYVIEV